VPYLAPLNSSQDGRQRGTRPGSMQKEVAMTAHVGDEIMIMSQMLHRSVREGEIREAVMSPVAWSTSCAGTPVTRACYGPDRTR
jgi:hypothetical protein